MAGSAQRSIFFLYIVIGYQQCFLYNLSSLILTPARAEIIFQTKKGIPGSLLKHNVLLRVGALSPLECFHFSFFSFSLRNWQEREHDVRGKRSTSLPWSSYRAPLTTCTPVNSNKDRPRVVLHFPSGTVERAKSERPQRLAFLSWADFHARSRLVCYTAVFRVVRQCSSPGGALRDDTKNGCVAD